MVLRQTCADVKAAPTSESMATSLAAAMLACCAGIFLADLLGLAGSSLGFAALYASGMASLAGMWTGSQGQSSSIFSGKHIYTRLFHFQIQAQLGSTLAQR